jgi:hypothetical protein
LLKGSLRIWQKNENARIANEDFDKLCISKFREDDLLEHQAKVIFAMGFLLGLRGNREHTYMKRSQICNGIFESDHPSFVSYEYWGISHFDSDKCHKVGKKSGYVS